ncbi:MAG: patatin-like phospholipase family protein [Treponema sp.]|nr:patatin-like phospholipase family protein [Treponema sp.]
MKVRFILFFLMIVKSVFAQEYGLVLSGGGGKGAYEVGVWKALKEYGIADKVTVISGTSVGGLNAALFSCEEIESIEKIWLEKVPLKLKTSESLISQDGLLEIINTVHLEKLKPYHFPHVIVTTVRNRFKAAKAVTGGRGDYSHRFRLNDEDDISEIKRMLLATSAFPVICSPVKLKDGHKYIDGGGNFMGGDNVPYSPVLDFYPSVKNLIVVYLDDNPKKKLRIKKIKYDDYDIIEIIPTIKMSLFALEGTVNFTQERIKLLIQQGYEDTVEVLKKHNSVNGVKLYPVSSYWFED